VEAELPDSIQGGEGVRIEALNELDLLQYLKTGFLTMTQLV